MLKLNIGLSRKVGEANYGSRGASVHLELEVESALIGDHEGLRQRVRQLFQMARASVDEELNGHGGPNGDRSNGTTRSTNGHSNGRQATLSQLRAIHAIADRQGIDLKGELRDRFGVERADMLGIGQASELIDAIKNARANGGRR
ncbi:hypothetical protein Pan216_04010 [Planctomycetes bacterium Pan216]|uniref:Uncharacterized protein n=1 Tax=Kolteria novifilia TaxID=2527975 RepID=A0A518AXX7_9BACT|nr:hypothetical protein Pan216_04010 [Planctomycetes bacterium Pan216]